MKEKNLKNNDTKPTTEDNINGHQNNYLFWTRKCKSKVYS